MQIGILGGTFDPIHQGHLALARAALDQLQLNKVIFIPAFRHPLEEKERITVALPEARFEMVKSVLQNEPKFEISDCEFKRKGISYTVDTLKELRRQYPKPNELFFITGGDWGKNLNQWKEMDTILSLAHFVVAKRPGFDVSQLPARIKLLDFVPLNVSSTEIRKRLRVGESISSFVPKQAVNYILKHHLYS